MWHFNNPYFTKWMNEEWYCTQGVTVLWGCRWFHSIVITASQMCYFFFVLAVSPELQTLWYSYRVCRWCRRKATEAKCVWCGDTRHNLWYVHLKKPTDFFHVENQYIFNQSPSLNSEYFIGHTLINLGRIWFCEIYISYQEAYISLNSPGHPQIIPENLSKCNLKIKHAASVSLPSIQHHLYFSMG